MFYKHITRARRMATRTTSRAAACIFCKNKKIKCGNSRPCPKCKAKHLPCVDIRTPLSATCGNAWLWEAPGGPGRNFPFKHDFNPAGLLFSFVLTVFAYSVPPIAFCIHCQNDHDMFLSSYRRCAMMRVHPVLAGYDLRPWN